MTALVFLATASREAHAFWLLNFQTASTLLPGEITFIGGTGGQLTSVGDPSLTSFTPFLAHAGIRYGIAEGLDMGYRLCTLTLPYSSAGPTLGAELDFKMRLTSPTSSWQLGLIGGIGYSYLMLSGQSRTAWAPGGDLVLTRTLTEGVALSGNARYVYTGITSGYGGASQNNLTAIGGSVGLKVALNSNISVLPELGLFDFTGNLGGITTNGWGLQYGAVLSARLK